MGAATLKAVAPKTCSVEGCCRPVRARGKCASHYVQWMRTQPPHIRMQAITLKTIKEAMPGTKGDLREATGVCAETVARSLRVLCDEGAAHIGDWQFPAKKGQKYEPIFYPGPGRDKRLTAEQRRKHTRMQDRESEQRRKLAAARPVASLGWASALLAT